MKSSLMRQTLVAAGLGLASLRTRLWPSLVILVSVASVVGVLLSLLSLSAGFLRSYRSGNDPAVAIVVSANAQNEGLSHIPRDSVDVILNAPGIARGAHGRGRAEAEATAWLTPEEGSAAVGFVIRGVGAGGATLRPQFKIIAGRMFRTGTRELIAGSGAQRVFGLNVGRKVVLPNGEWSIVGVYSASGNIIESDLMADVDSLMSAMRLSSFSSVLVRLEGPAALTTFKHWVETNPALSVSADRQSDFYLRTETDYNIRFFNSLAYIVGVTMAIGTVFGLVKILYATVRARTREIATLRALGYEAFPVAASVVLQALTLCVLGALIGAGIAWALFDGKLTWYYNNIFTLEVPPRLIALGIAWAASMALLGGVPPAVRAASLPVSAALREV
jgi:putative ABC transport system permease protein